MDQDFDDRQFEAYLALGEHVGGQLVSSDWAPQLESQPTFESWITKLVNRMTER